MQQLEALRQRQRGGKANHLNLFGFFVMGSLILGGVNLLINLGLLFAYQGVANKKPPTLVQAVDGRAMVVNPMETRDRSPIVIRRFVGDALGLLLSSSGKIPNAAADDKPGAVQPDPGVPIKLKNGTEAKVSTATWQASFALSGDFRPSALIAIASLTPAPTFAGQAQMMLIPQYISEPEKVGQGQWKVNVIANLVTVAPGQTQGIAVPFNKEVYVRSIDTPTPTEAATPLERAVFAMRQSGLEIYAMKDYTPGAIKQ
jgi:hypothetical protein